MQRRRLELEDSPLISRKNFDENSAFFFLFPPPSTNEKKSAKCEVIY
jgi:hypothetical protein